MLSVDLPCIFAAEDIPAKVYGSLQIALHVIRSDKCRHVELIRLFTGTFAKLRKASQCLSVRLCAWNNSAPTGRIFIKFDI
jgi:hypothetical protein